MAAKAMNAALLLAFVVWVGCLCILVLLFLGSNVAFSSKHAGGSVIRVKPQHHNTTTLKTLTCLYLLFHFPTHTHITPSINQRQQQPPPRPPFLLDRLLLLLLLLPDLVLHWTWCQGKRSKKEWQQDSVAHHRSTTLTTSQASATWCLQHASKTQTCPGATGVR